MKHDILEEIVAHKKIELQHQKKAVPLHIMLGLASENMDRPTYSMRESLEKSDSSIIAEFKRKSPSKGWLHPKAVVSDIIPAYQANGASACSILTDEHFFGGSLGDLKKARQLTTLPLLRKDFVLESYQLFQAKAMGADAVLLIAAILNPEDCEMLANTAHTLGLEVLLEIHREEELKCLNPYVDMLGINNRNLGSFDTQVNHSLDLLPAVQAYLQKEKVYTPLLITESGIRDPKDVILLRQEGFRGFLIGETFMKTENPGETLRSFIQTCTSHAD